MSEAAVTIVVVPRERFSNTRPSLESIYANTSMPFSLVYVDGGSPRHIKRYLERQAREMNFKLVRTEHYLSPNEARNIGFRHVHTKWVAFVDNDVLVTPGWLEALLRCAGETDASVVGPVYLWDDPELGLIHCAGSTGGITLKRGKRGFTETQRYSNELLSEVRPQLRREPIDMAEFHCMLVRSEVLERVGLFDEAMLSMREHVDFCVTVRKAGGTIYFEPDAVVSYVRPPPFAWSDIPFYLLRWSDEWAVATLRHAKEKWKLNRDDSAHHANWVRPHRRRALRQARDVLQGIFGQRFGDKVEDAMDRVLIRSAVAKRANALRPTAAADARSEDNQRRARRPSVSLAEISQTASGTLIVTAADKKFFNLLKDLILSLRDKKDGKTVTIGIVDLGMKEVEIDWLEKYAVLTVKPERDFSVPDKIWGSPQSRSRMVRPFLPRYFPGFEVYLWIDSDVWVQQWSGIDLYIAGAARKGMAVTSEVHPSYYHSLGSVMWKYRRFEIAYGADLAKKLIQTPHINSGIFAIKKDAPHWEVWANWLQTAIKAIGDSNSNLISDQIPLNSALYMEKLPYESLPASCNWQCHLSLPKWDDSTRRFCEPAPPHQNLSLIHLTGQTKENKEFPIETTSEKTRLMKLRYQDHQG